MSSLSAKISVVLLFILIIGFFVLQNNGMGEIAYPQAVLTLEKESFTAVEPVVLTITLNESEETAHESFLPKAFAQETGPFKTSVIGPDGREVSDVPVRVKKTGEGLYQVQITPSSSMKPGKQTLQVELRDGLATRTIEQDFLWGVLAINTNKSIYTPGEKAELAMAVLNEKGEMVCSADLSLKITAPDGGVTRLASDDDTIIVHPDCYVYKGAKEPDYEAMYQVGGVGKYKMELTATTENGTYTISDTFDVKESVPFIVERIAHTRIYPQATYTVELKVHAQQGFSGIIEETIPSHFSLETEKTAYKVRTEDNKQKLQWETKLNAGDDMVLSYTYDAPDISPEFYTLGPLTFTQGDSLVFQEARLWQIASDAVPARVQVKSAVGSSVTLTSAPTNGNALIAIIGEGDTATISSISQTGATWVQAVRGEYSSGSLSSVDIWYALNVTNAGTSITVNFSGSATNPSIVVAEYSGIAASAALDKTANSGGFSSTVSTGTTATTTQSDELWIGGMSIRDAGTFGTPTNSFIEVAETGATYNAVLQERIVSTTGAATTTSTLSGSKFWAGAVATFKASTAAPTPTPTPTSTPTATPTPTPVGPTATPTPTPTPGHLQFEGLKMEGIKVD